MMLTDLAFAMAELAHIGGQIGYPYAEELCWEALSMLGAPLDAPGWLGTAAPVALALYLAFGSPEVSVDFVKHLLAMELRPPPGGGSWPTSWHKGLCAAAAVADARAAVAIVRSVPERLPNVDGPVKLDCYVAAADVLTTPRHRRRAKVFRQHAHSWVPGSEAE